MDAEQLAQAQSELCHSRHLGLGVSSAPGRRAAGVTLLAVGVALILGWKAIAELDPLTRAP
jgi:hypothetical protein